MKAFFESIVKMVKDCLTENDGISYCPIRIVGSGLILPSIGVFLYASIMKAHAGTLVLMDFATSLGVMVASVTTCFSAAIAVKALTDK